MIVIQSAKTGWPLWIDRCIDSVRSWTSSRGIEHRIIGDEFFAPISQQWIARAGEQKLPHTDLARLLWIEKFLSEGHERVAWLDADVFIIDPAFTFPGGDFFCQEKWIYLSRDGYYLFDDRVNNCAMSFSKNSQLLSWYIGKCLYSNIGNFSRLELGTSLLTSQHKINPLPLIKTIPTLSPAIVNCILMHDRKIIDSFLAHWGAPVSGAHLCRSLQGTPHGPRTFPDDCYERLIASLEAGALMSRK